MSAVAPVTLQLPFRGRWMARNSPANAVPSHGTHLFGTTYAIDFIRVDQRGRPAAHSWRSVFATEPPERFLGFGSPVVAPADSEVVSTHDGEPDHEARRSQLTLVGYALSQASRVRGGAAKVAGNHVVLALGPAGPFVLLAHLKQGSVGVSVGDTLRAGELVGLCGNSGNSTQPHVHLQVTDSSDWATARGIPVAFRRSDGAAWMPRNSEAFTA